MLNLLKSDLYRLVHGKMLWVLIAVMAIGAAFVVAMSWFVSTDTFREMAMQSASSGGQGGTGISVGVQSSGGADITAIDTIDATTVPGLTYVAGGTIVGGGFIVLLHGLFTALFLSSDVSTGFLKGVLAARRNRMAYYLEKLLVIELVALAFVVVGVATCAIGTTVAGFTFTDPDSIGILLAWMALSWLIACAYACIVALITWITRSVVAGTVTAVGITMAEGIVQSVLGSLFPGSTVAGAIAGWLPLTSAGLLGAGSGFLSAAAPAGEVITPLAHVLITGIVCVAVFGCASLTIARKRDV